MTNTTSVQILTKAGEELLARLAAEEKELVIDKYVFADVPERPDFPQREDGVPTDYVVHESIIHEKGRLNPNSVIYSSTLASDVGPFHFNWSGLYCSEHDVLVTIHYPQRTPKTADQPGVAGNTLVRSQVLQYTGVADITNITVDASSWQYNADPRMKKMDSDSAQAIVDQNGKDWFIEDGFLVTPQSTAFKVAPGAGYVSGHRVTLEFERFLQVPVKPSFIYIDAYREGTPTGEWVTTFNFVVSADEKDDYLDDQGLPHYVVKIAQVMAEGSVIDLRSLPAVEKRSRLTVKASEMPSYPDELSIYEALDKAVRVKAARVIIDDLICELTQKKECYGLRNCRVTFSGCELTVADLSERLVFIDPVNCVFESDCSEIKGAIDNQQYAIDNPVETVLPAIKLIRPYFCRTKNFFATNVRAIVDHFQPQFCTATGNHVRGGLNESAENSSGLGYGANFMTAVCFSGGAHNLAYGNSAEDHGSAVLVGIDSHGFVGFANVGENLHDNGVYVSSGNGCVNFANAFRKVRGAGVKSRGSNNISVLNTVENANVAVDVTGNGTVLDSRGANGASNILALNSAKASRAHDFRVTSQDGFKSRDSILALNASNGHKGVDGYYPVLVVSKEGGIVLGNLISESGADYSFVGQGSADDGKELVVAGNMWGGGKYFGSRMIDTDKYIYAINAHKAGLNGLEGRQLDIGAIIGNITDLEKTVATLSNVYGSTKAILTANVGLIAGHATPGQILSEGNYNGDIAWPISDAPIRSLQFREIAGEIYVSVSSSEGGFKFIKLNTDNENTTEPVA